MGRALIAWLFPHLLGFGLVLLPAAPAQSQGLVVRDGTLGSGPLEAGPGIDPLGQPATYLIPPQMGEQRGSPDGWLPATVGLEPIAGAMVPAQGPPSAALAIVHTGRCR